MKGYFEVQLPPIKRKNYDTIGVIFHGEGKYDGKSVKIRDDLPKPQPESYTQGLFIGDLINEWLVGGINGFVNVGLKFLDSNRHYKSLKSIYYIAQNTGLNKLVEGEISMHEVSKSIRLKLRS